MARAVAAAGSDRRFKIGATWSEAAPRAREVNSRLERSIFSRPIAIITNPKQAMRSPHARSGWRIAAIAAKRVIVPLQSAGNPALRRRSAPENQPQRSILLQDVLQDVHLFQAAAGAKRHAG